MSYNLSISGHTNDAELAASADELLRVKGAELVAALADLGTPASYASTSGPTGAVDFLAPVPGEDSAGLRQLTGEDSPGG